MRGQAGVEDKTIRGEEVKDSRVQIMGWIIYMDNNLQELQQDQQYWRVTMCQQLKDAKNERERVTKGWGML